MYSLRVHGRGTNSAVPPGISFSELAIAVERLLEFHDARALFICRMSIVHLEHRNAPDESREQNSLSSRPSNLLVQTTSSNILKKSLCSNRLIKAAYRKHAFHVQSYARSIFYSWLHGFIRTTMLLLGTLLYRWLSLLFFLCLSSIFLSFVIDQLITERRNENADDGNEILGTF